MGHKVEMKPVTWLWADRIPEGKITFLDGPPDVLKTTIALDICARVTTGDPLPGDDLLRAPGGAIFVSYEDDPADTLLPRFRAAHGDPQWMLFVDGNEDEVSFPSSEPRLLDLVGRLKPRIIVIDPVMAALDRDVKSASDQDVRRALGGPGVYRRAAEAVLAELDASRSSGR